MKKIIMLAFLVLLFACSVCSAFEPPNPDRWEFIKGTDEYEFWLDKMNIRFIEKKNDVYAEIWVRFHLKDGDLVKMEKEEINLDEKKIRTIESYDVDGDGNWTPAEEEETEYNFIPITKRSNLDELYKAVYRIYKDGGRKAEKLSKKDKKDEKKNKKKHKKTKKRIKKQLLKRRVPPVIKLLDAVF